MITRVTITGADDSIQPVDLLDMQQDFPFVEWGILLSRFSQNSKRFPSADWLLALYHYKRGDGEELALSAHLCGAWVRELLVNNRRFVSELTPEIWSLFDRAQINTHAESHAVTGEAILRLGMENPDKEFIFQYDDVNAHLLDYAKHYSLTHSALFDLSHGIGKLPNQCPDLLPDVKCGYAGGLSPENLQAQIERIEEKAGDTPIWIDMETHVRSNNDKQFDLKKVYRCLEISAKYVRTI